MAQNLLNTLARVQTQVALIVDKQTKRCTSGRRSKQLSSRPNSSPSELSFFEDARTTDLGCKYSRPLNLFISVLFFSVSGDEVYAAAVQSHSATPTPSSPDHAKDCLDEQMKRLIELLVEIDHDMANLEFSLISSFPRKIRTEAEVDSLQVNFNLIFSWIFF